MVFRGEVYLSVLHIKGKFYQSCQPVLVNAEPNIYWIFFFSKCQAYFKDEDEK